MFGNNSSMQYFSSLEFIDYFKSWGDNPINLIIGIIDIVIVIFLIYKAVRLLRETRAWQLLKGIAILVILTLLTGWLHFGILNAILTTVMTYRSIYPNCSVPTRIEKKLRTTWINWKTKKVFRSY